MVYFLQDILENRIKIGYVDVMSVEDRIHQIRLEHQRPFRLLATVEGYREREYELHQQFKHSRLIKNIRMSEWFRMSDDLCCFVSDLNPKLRLISESNMIWKAGKCIRII